MSELMQHQVRVEGRWRPRFVLAALVRVVAYGVPVLVGSSVAWLVSRELQGAAHQLLRTVTVLGAAVAVSLLVSRLTMKLMPLAVLLRMTMIFPDLAPSRFKVARLTTSAKDIAERLHSRSADESEAATTMLALVTALGRHDRRTRGHSERVRLFCDLLSDELKLSEADAGRLRWAALIHDIGKLEVPEAILNKPAELTEDEWKVVRHHPIDGARLARPLEHWLGPWFAGIAHHHEQWDGSGYPMGLAGEAISRAGRAIAVVDSFETMTSARSYKSARSTLSARTELALCAGSHFDPAMVRAFLAISLPKLLWSVGPLAFLVNVPYLKWAVEGGVRTADVAAAATSATANAAGVTVVAVAMGAMPSSAAGAVPNVPPSTTSQAGTAASAGTQARPTRGTPADDAKPNRLAQGPFATMELPAVQHANPPGLANRPSVPGATRDDRKGHKHADKAGQKHAKKATTAHRKAQQAPGRDGHDAKNGPDRRAPQASKHEDGHPASPAAGSSADEKPPQAAQRSVHNAPKAAQTIGKVAEKSVKAAVTAVKAVDKAADAGGKGEGGKG